MKILNQIMDYIILISALVIIISTFAFWVQNPELTQMQIFLHFLPVYVVFFPVLILAYLMLTKKSKRTSK